MIVQASTAVSVGTLFLRTKKVASCCLRLDYVAAHVLSFWMLDLVKMTLFKIENTEYLDFSFQL
jgi:hypothetical protein